MLGIVVHNTSVLLDLSKTKLSYFSSSLYLIYLSIQVFF